MVEVHSEERVNNQKNMQNVIPGPPNAPWPTNVDYNDGDNKDVSSKGVESCYVFKSRLQEYAQKVGFPTPVYYTAKEGPSHQPLFKSTVTVNDVTYDSLPGFFNRKAAEQSAAEVALVEISESGQGTESIPIVHESGLCKNMVQEYAQKMNYAIPVYKIRRVDSATNPFICTVDIGGILYIGAAARTKKEAEIKAARTVLVAIQDTSKYGINSASQYTVLPSKKKGTDIADQQLKPKKVKTKKKWNKRKFPRKKKPDEAAMDKDDQCANPGGNADGQTANNFDGQTVNPGNIVDVQSGNACQSVSAINRAYGQSVRTGYPDV